MLFFRSEELFREWCAADNHPMRPLVTMDQLWRLATTWYSTRLEENSRRPQPDEICFIFAGLGLRGDFWDSQSILSANKFAAGAKRRTPLLFSGKAGAQMSARYSSLRARSS